MGRFARDVQEHLRDCLETDHPYFEWTMEHYVAGTPVDLFGEDDDNLVCIELEWRRADPADNTAKLFRSLVSFRRVCDDAAKTGCRTVQ
jgi:hypothetical protein